MAACAFLAGARVPKRRRAAPTHLPGMNERTILVTGANKGIGYEAAALLAERGHTVLVGARDLSRGKAAVEALRNRTKSDKIHFIELDVASERSIASASERIKAHVGRLDVLVNNAGIADGAAHSMKQGIAAMRAIFETNLFGLVALTQALLPIVLRSPSPRIVNVSSSLSSLTLASDWNHNIAKQDQYFAYSCSKTALNAFTVRLAYDLRDTKAKVNSACPGYCATDLNQHTGFRTAAQGAKILAHLAALPDDGPTGSMFDDDGRVPF